MEVFINNKYLNRMTRDLSEFKIYHESSYDFRFSFKNRDSAKKYARIQHIYLPLNVTNIMWTVILNFTDISTKFRPY